MSSIVPNGQIRFLSQIPIDANYENSLDFLSEVEQRTYFLSQQPVHTMLGATRIRDGVIAVNSLADNLLSANYMMFQNTNFSNKWFYAFITNIEYVNNNMSHVYYQIDDIQTWLFDVQLAQCFVEREHTATDGLFEHLVDEGISVKDYIKSGSMNEVNLSAEGGGGMSAVLFTGSYPVEVEEPEEGEPDYVIRTAQPRKAQGLIQGTYVFAWKVIKNNGDPDTDELRDFALFIDRMVEAEQKDSIVTCVMYPTALLNWDSFTENVEEDYGFPAFTPTVLPTLNGYTPRNKKMYNSPYCIMTLMTSEGQKINFQPEYFNDPSSGKRFTVLNNVSPNPSVMIVGNDYKGKEYNYEKSLSIDSFPQVSLSIDGYKAWVASGGLDRLNNQTSASILSDFTTMGLAMIGGGIGGAVGTLAGGPIGTVAGASAGISLAGALAGGTGLLKDIQNEMTTLEYARKLPAEVKNTTNGTPLYAGNKLSIFTSIETATRDVAKSIDDYLTMFGYKVNKLKQPSRRNRPHFTYLKTKGLHVNGGAPADAIQRIETIYDNGIRFWVNPAEVGNYNVNNAPV